MIEHEGVIVKSSSSGATVKIINKAACASCQLNGKCNLSDVKEKFIDVSTSGRTYQEGDHVTVTGAESIGFKALFLGYILPFLIVLGTVVTFTVLNYSEPVAGLVALGTLVPYYLILKLMSNKIQKQFSFYLKNT
ncbi:MAG TPA: SoxR reducing system RseC family protein [Salinivirga sp.]|uniref:SoxR reducing system RseC family protein n=1 Tax=Salinivirga sp. TaxID=1970192 RepID=UPI002B47DA36|nr:SoxR reducing system RseC family protein [Salinivirga sp.]HKK60154.1 SoxR reducing system RseC family protein [Salinivirga sp.]